MENKSTSYSRIKSVLRKCALPTSRLTWNVFKLGGGSACPRNKDAENVEISVGE